MTRKSLMLVAAAFGGLCVRGEVQNLWPEGKIPDFQAGQFAAPSQESKRKDFNRAEHAMPYLDWSEKPANPNGACVILISGGAYVCTCDGPAFKPLEKTLLDNGVTCVWLWYRVPRPNGAPIYRSGWQDGQRAVRLVRSQAAARGIDPERIGVLGCSAGSHLSVMLATSALTPAYARVDGLDDLPCHVNWAIPMCPAYVLSDGLTARNSRDGDAIDITLNPSFKFDAKTAPMCFFHGGADIYSPNGSTQLYRQLRRMKVPAELHLDAGRGHGPVNAAAFGRAIEFMRQMGFLGKLGPLVEERTRYSDAATAAVEREALWPAGRVPDAQAVHTEAPYLEWYIPKEIKTKAIQVITPGGGYNHCNVSGEGVPVARWFNAKGMAAVVVKYRCPRPQGLAKHTSAWQDAQRAIRLVRKGAAARGLDPDRIGLMGFSAGGHLTLMTATSSRSGAYNPVDDVDKISCKVQWACPIYPAYALTDGADCPNVKGGNEDDAVSVPEFAFDLDTPPMCFVHGDADVWAAMNSVKTWERLRRMGLQSDLHTLATRGHCFQFKASEGTGSYTWLERLWEFLTRTGLNK